LIEVKCDRDTEPAPHLCVVVTHYPKLYAREGEVAGFREWNDVAGLPSAGAPVSVKRKRPWPSTESL